MIIYDALQFIEAFVYLPRLLYHYVNNNLSKINHKIIQIKFQSVKFDPIQIKVTCQ